MNAETLAMLLVDDMCDCDDVQLTAVTCDQCFNADVDRFENIGFDSEPLVLHVRCMQCSSVSDILLEDWVSDRSGNCDDAWLTEMVGYMSDTNEEYKDYDNTKGCSDVIIDDLPFSCYCGNHEVACFQTYFHPASRQLSWVKCLNCDSEKVLEEFFGVECGYCGNDNKELFERRFDDYGRTTYLRCWQCDKHLYVPGQPAPRKGRMNGADLDVVSSVSRKSGHEERQVANVPGWTKIADLRDIRRGDHVAWHKWYALWHHAIVVDVPDGGGTLKVIHYNGDIVKVDGHFASIREETLEVNPVKDDFYRIDYSLGDVYPVKKVIERARSRLGEAKYGPLSNNCEHFARWCKTGRAECGQVQTFKERLGLAYQTAVTKATQEAAADGIEAVVVGQLSRAAFGGIRQRAGQVFGAAPGVVRNVKCGALACNIAVSLVMESAFFTKDAVVAYQKYKSGAISRDEFRRQLGKRGCESVGGLVGGAGMGILGQVFIPIPFLGGFIGCTLGNLIGRYVGAIIGKQIVAIKH